MLEVHEIVITSENIFLHSRKFPLALKLFPSLRFIFHALKQRGIKYTVELS